MSPPRGGLAGATTSRSSASREAAARRSGASAAPRRRRVGVLAGAVGIVLAGVFLTVGLGGAIAYQQGCDALVAASRSRSARTRSSTPRTARCLGVDPVRRTQPPAGHVERDQPVGREGDGRDRGQALLAARRRRPDRHHARVLAPTSGRARSSRAARRSRSSSCATSTSRASARSRGSCARRASPIKLAGKWSKERILTAYMNQVYYGSQAYGVEAASQTYFSKPAKKLTLAQAALLAGLPQAPSRYDPFANPRAARARRNRSCARCSTTGVHHATQYRTAVRNRSLRSRSRARSTRRSASRTSSATCATSSFASTAKRACARRPAGVHDDRSAAAARGAQGDQRHAVPAERSGRGDRLDRSARPARSVR